MSKSWLALLASAVAVSGCGGEPFGGLTATLSAEIETADTTMFSNDAIVVRAVAQYTFGPGAPRTISWAVSDTSKLAAFILSDLSTSVSAKDTGVAWVIARINEDFRDSVQITVVDEGLVRWRAAVTGAPALLPAIAGDSSVVVVHGAGTASAISPLGEQRFTFAVCNGSLGPTLPAGKIVTTGDACTSRADTSGTADWSLPIGDAASGVALAADGSVIVLHETGQPADVVVLSSISSSGVEMWRDTLRDEALAQASAPAIATNGDIYVPWRAPADSSWLTRVAADGTVRWQVPMPGWSRYASPALAGNRIVVGHEGGVTVFDTAGVVVWSRAFTADLPGAAVDARASSPIIDGTGNIFVQSEAGLVSYLPGGTTQWAADSLGYGSTTGGVGGPVLLLDGTIVVPCQSGAVREVCGVRQPTGSLAWRSAVGGGSAEGLVVGKEGTVFVTWAAGGGGGEIVALWARSRVDPVGWPVAGRTTARTRRAN